MEDRMRVVVVSMDVVIPDTADGFQIAQQIQDLVNNSSLNCNVAASDIGGDITDIYERDYPEFITLEEGMVL